MALQRDGRAQQFGVPSPAGHQLETGRAAVRVNPAGRLAAGWPLRLNAQVSAVE